MVRKYVKKGQRQLWTDDNMRTAIEAVLKNGFSIKKASVAFKVPHATLSRKVNQCRLDPERQNELLANPKSNSLQTVFTKDQEKTLCNYVKTMENAMIGLVGADVRRLAFQLAEKCNVPHRFKKDSESAGEDWYRGFISRNPHIKVKRGDTPYEKSKVFSKEKVYKFFDSLESFISEYNLKPSDIYTLDETVIKCMCINPQDSTKDSQDKLVTAVISLSASGDYVPLLMVFPDKIKTRPLLDGAPPAAWALVNSSGQMQLDIFISWLEKFISFRKPTISTPVLIVVDGYHSYLKNIDVLELMTNNGIHILCLPPNCGSKLHPSKSSFMRTLGQAYIDEVTVWTKVSAWQPVTADEVFKLFGNAYTKVATIPAAQISFASAGTWPTNRHLFENQFISVYLNPSLTLNNSNSTSESSMSNAFEEEGQPIKSDLSIPSVTSDLHEPMIVISQNIVQSHELQETHQVDQPLDQSFEHLAEEGHFLQIETDPLETTILPDIEAPESSIVIPAEAQLTEVQLQDIQFLAQSQRKLYYYVSPYKLTLS